jgi:hypothetical protein
MMAREFCPQCGTARTGAFRFCRSCQFNFDAVPAIAPAPFSSAPVPAALPSVIPVPNTAATLAGVAWLGAAAVTGILAFQQWDAGRLLTSLGDSDQGLVANAIWNAVAALLTAYFGARCLRSPNKGFLTTSTAWGVLNVAWGIYQVANGATYWLFYVVLVVSGLAGVLSFAARDAAAPSSPPATS